MRKPDLLLIADLPPAEEEALAGQFVVHRLWEQADRPAFLKEQGPRIRAAATRGDTGIDGATMRALPALEIVSIFGVGYDAVDLECARARGIKITNTPDVLTDDVADMGMALLLAVSRRIVSGDRHVRSRAWSSSAFPLTTSVRGKTLGIFGLGRVGKAIARRAEAFGMTIAYTGRSRQAGVDYAWHADLAALAAASDVLMLSAAANDTTNGAVDARVLAALGPEGILVNIARGALVDEEALIEALRSGTIGGAGLDVYQNEPTPDPRFLELANVVLQPHAGSGTHETRAAMGELMRANLAAHFAGAALHSEVI